MKCCINSGGAKYPTNQVRRAPIARSKNGKVVNTKYTHKEVAHTVKTFCEQYNKGTYIVIVRKHALTIKDGIVIDNPNYRFTGYRRIVESAVRIS